MEIEEGKLYRISEVAEMLGIPKSSLARWARTGELPAKKLGRNWHLTGAEVKALAQNGTIQKKE